jgi:CRP-like cAMP-binding protein
MAAPDLNSVAFPRLDDAHMGALERCAGATLKHYATGDKLIEVGERGFKFLVIKSGEILLVDESSETPTILAVLGRGQFTGDVATCPAAHHSSVPWPASIAMSTRWRPRACARSSTGFPTWAT